MHGTHPEGFSTAHTDTNGAFVFQSWKLTLGLGRKLSSDVFLRLGERHRTGVPWSSLGWRYELMTIAMPWFALLLLSFHAHSFLFF